MFLATNFDAGWLMTQQYATRSFVDLLAAFATTSNEGLQNIFSFYLKLLSFLNKIWWKFDGEIHVWIINQVPKIKRLDIIDKFVVLLNNVVLILYLNYGERRIQIE